MKKSRQVVRAEDRAIAKRLESADKLAARREKQAALKSKRRLRPRPAKKHYPGEPITFDKRDSDYVQVGRLFRP
jgi:hypothetical protein